MQQNNYLLISPYNPIISSSHLPLIPLLLPSLRCQLPQKQSLETHLIVHSNSILEI